MKLVVLAVCLAFIAFGAAEEFVCKPNVSYIENECNVCSCTDAGALGCTYKACLGPDKAKLHNCEVGTTWDKECNKCWCVKNQGTICTNTKC